MLSRPAPIRARCDDVGNPSAPSSERANAARASAAVGLTAGVLGGLNGRLTADDRAVGEEIGLQLGRERWVVAPDPLEHHRRMLHFFVTVVLEDLAQLGILGRIHAL